MSENVSTKQAVEERSGEVTGARDAKEWSVDAYADRLMDDLFEDLERVLDGGSRLPNQTIPPDVISLRSIEVPQIVLPQLINSQPGQQTVDTKAVAAGEKQEKSGKWVDRLLFGGACASLAILLGLWLWNRGELQRLWTMLRNEGPRTEAVREKTPAELKAEADAEFMRYLEQALETIDRQEKMAAQPSPSDPGLNPAGVNVGPPEVRVTVNPTLEAVPGGITNNQAEALHRIAIALERISIPGATVAPTTIVRVPETPPPPIASTVAPQTVAPKPVPKPEQTPAPQASPKPGSVSARGLAPAPGLGPSPGLAPGIGPVSGLRLAPGLGPVSAPIPSRVPTVVAPAPAPAPSEPSEEKAAVSVAVPEPSGETAPAVPEASEPKPEVAEPEVAEPEVAEPEVAEPAPTSGAPITNDPLVTHTLTGLLELGDRSAALFDIDGITKRVKIGESIGSSGWTLVEVKNQEAVMRRNGEVRSIYVGQSF